MTYQEWIGLIIVIDGPLIGLLYLLWKKVKG